MKNKIFSLILVGFFALFLPCFVNAETPQLHCEYEGILGTYCRSNDESCRVKVTLKLEQNQWSTPTFTWVNDFLEGVEGCEAGGDFSSCLKNYNSNGLSFDIISDVKVVKPNNGKYEIITGGYTDYFLNSDKTYYQCPETINILKEEKRGDKVYGLAVFVSNAEFNESYCDNNGIGSFNCDGSNYYRDTMQKTKQVSAMPYTGVEIEHSSGSCCVYYDSSAYTTPVYVYTFSLSNSMKKQYAACVGLNCMTLIPTTNHILNTESTNDTSWSDFYKLDNCSEMPSKIYFTYKGRTHERTLDASLTCKAPTSEPTNINNTYSDAVIHPTKQSADDLIGNGSNNQNGSNPDYEGIQWGEQVPLDCEGIFGDELLDFIGEIFKWIRIIAPIAVILLSSVEFAGALLQDDRDALKKATNRFIKRLIIAVALFFVPLILEFILNVFNEISKANTDICNIGK